MGEKRYKTGELAAVAQVSAKTIRLYEKKGLLTSKRDETNGYRRFSEEAVVQLQKIRMLKYLGFGLDDIKVILEQYKHLNLTESFLEQKRMLEKKALELERMIYCMDRTARESRLEGFRIESLFDALRNIIISREADEGVYRMYGHVDEPRGWSRWIYEQADIRSGDRILDAGCGWGNLWRFNEDRYKNDIDVTLVDFHNTHADDLAEYIQDKPWFHFLWGDLNTLDFPEKYDCIFFNHVVRYMEEPTETYERLKGFLRPGGKLIATWGGLLLVDNLAELLWEQDGGGSAKSRPKTAAQRKLRERQEELRQGMKRREEELRQVFGEVVQHRYPVELHFDNAGEMVDYLEPVIRWMGLNPAEYLPAFEKFLEARFGGTPRGFHIERDSYLYVCRA